MTTAVFHFHDHAHKFWNVIDASATLAALSAPVWWQLIDSFGQFVILALGIIGGTLRVALLLREWMRGRRNLK